MKLSGGKRRMNNNIKLETKFVDEIEGTFVIPSYQRGYRWGKIEIERLLNDIRDNCNNNKDNYCLQPIVVKKNAKGEYELIDGQQRLTTIYLIYKCLNDLYKQCRMNDLKPNFEINYAIRTDSKNFLEDISSKDCKEYIDFWFIYHAYNTIIKFLDHDRRFAFCLQQCFKDNIKIIWYEVGENEDDTISLFSRLNIGKIPLTNSELVKAMFLSDAGKNEDSDIKPQEIAFQWDYIETALHNESFWLFLTNPSDQEYQTRIELILKLIVNKDKKETDSSDRYATFYNFYERHDKGEKLSDIWNEIYKTFMLLKEWYEHRNYYHMIGFLIASVSKSLNEIYIASKGKTKTVFEKDLIDYIKAAVKLNDGEKYEDMSYENRSDYEKIKKLLLLFNVESVRCSEDQYQRFPFDQYKVDNNGRKNKWSLEHIHAQHSEGLKKENYKEWLEKHLKSVRAVSKLSTDPTKTQEFKNIMNDMGTALNKGNNLSPEEFELIREKVVEVLSEKGSNQYMHSIANLALLAGGDNSSLSNSTFDVKRDDIIKMEGEGSFIPLCTKRVFLKYYTDSEDNQIHFWGEADRKAYIGEINKTLGCYDVIIDI